MLKIYKSETPASLGYFMPAEWEYHDRCWMGWPTDEIAWRGRHLEAKKTISDLANIIVKYEPVVMLVPKSEVKIAKELCDPAIEIISMDLNDSWLRDTAPSFIIKGGFLAGVNWIFNGWGDMEYANYDKDSSVAIKVCQELTIPCFSAPLVNEGGAIHVDGDGTVLCTKNTLLNDNRNPGKDITEVETVLKEYLGAKKVLWLDEGYDQDETGGHIDVICAFGKPGVVLHLTTDNEDDKNYKIFKDNIKKLESLTDAKGRIIKVIKIPMPEAKYSGDRRLAISYLNFYFANGAIIVPIFNDPMDCVALDIFRHTFPNKEIVSFNANLIFHGGGGIHCVTQQQPSVKGV